jgi:hypothetical protein
MDKLWKCPAHDRVAEIYCKTCKSYICVECLTTHAIDGHKPEYIHVLKYSPTVALPLLDHILSDIGSKDSELNFEASEFISTMTAVLPQVKEAIFAHAQSVSLLKTLVTQLEGYLGPVKQQPFVDRIRMGLTSDKKRLEKAYETKDVQTIITLTKKIEAEAKVSAGSEGEKVLIKKTKEKLATLSDLSRYKELIEVIQLLVFKCQHFRLNQSLAGWRCDRKYLSTKMTLSEDGLTFGNQAGNGYPAIIGDVPFDSGIFAFEVSVSGLCCNGKEGFGIIELEKYLTAHRADNTTPAVYDHMIGLLHTNLAKNMTVVSGHDLRMNEKYVVRVDLLAYQMTIKGPGASLKADLKPDTAYVPCFSCGCRNNKIVIKPLEGDIDD